MTAAQSFKQKLKTGEVQLGLWLALANPYTAELLGDLGYDWVLIDAEHAPNDIPLILSQLQALKAAQSHAIVRPPHSDAALLKLFLDIGAHTLLVPMVESAEQAQAIVRACRYPPHGIRGVGAALARASAFGQRSDYLHRANDEVCLILQVESLRGMDAIEEIAAVEGVDGIFIGPADLAADMGYLGNPGAPEVVAAVENGIQRIRAAGQIAGFLTSSPETAKRWIELGARFAGIGNDVSMLASAGTARLAQFKRQTSSLTQY